MIIRNFRKNFNILGILCRRHHFNVLFFGNDNVSLECLKSLYYEKCNNSNLIGKLDVLTTPLESKKSIQNVFHSYIEENKLSILVLK